MSKLEKNNFYVRNTEPSDFDEIVRLCAKVYSNSESWERKELASHHSIFPEGQFVVVERSAEKVVGFSASLIIDWHDYDMQTDWKDFTAQGTFRNHDPIHGLTLYGAEVMVDPDYQGHGLGKMLYRAREKLVRKRGLLRIRAGGRLRGYHLYADQMGAEDYVRAVIEGKIVDPTLSFQLKWGFHVLGVASNYLRADPESKGYAAIIEWINPDIATEQHYLDLARSKFYFPKL